MASWKPLDDKESKLAVAAFDKAMPGVYGVAEAIDEMLNALFTAGIIARAAAVPESEMAQENARLRRNLSKERLDTLNLDSMLDELEDKVKVIRDHIAGREAA
jgi:hypothetical protein